jgi:hypothetical protein
VAVGGTAVTLGRVAIVAAANVDQARAVLRKVPWQRIVASAGDGGRIVLRRAARLHLGRFTGSVAT